MKAADLVELVRNGVRPVVVFSKSIEDAETYPEPGMRARVTGVLSVDADEDLLKIAVDYGEFDSFNRPFESANYYDKQGNPTLTAREAGYYKPNDTLYLSLSEEIGCFRVVEDARTALYQTYLDGGGSGTYLEWLENQVLSEPRPVRDDATQRREFLEQINRHIRVEEGWHGNPDNHTLSVTLFFGDFDPRPYVAYDARGHGTLTETLLEQLLRPR